MRQPILVEPATRRTFCECQSSADCCYECCHPLSIQRESGRITARQVHESANDGQTRRKAFMDCGSGGRGFELHSVKARSLRAAQAGSIHRVGSLTTESPCEETPAPPPTVGDCGLRVAAAIQKEPMESPMQIPMQYVPNQCWKAPVSRAESA
jgi:hypothetical protein